MPPRNQKPIRAWTTAELEDEKLRNFMIAHRGEMLVVLQVCATTAPSPLVQRLLAEYRATGR